MWAESNQIAEYAMKTICIGKLNHFPTESE